MPNPRAQQQLAQVSTNPLDRAVQSFKSIKEPAQALGDMLAATLRGSTATTLGAGGDIRELVDLLGPEKVEALLGKRVMPTTEEMKEMLPKATSYEHPYESIGEFLPLPGTGTALKAAGYGLGRAAGAGTRAIGEAVSDAMIHQAGPLSKGPLSALAPRAAMTNVIESNPNWKMNTTNIGLPTPGIMIPSKMSEVREAVRNMKGNYGARRVERAADEIPNLERMFQADALKEAFTGDNASAMVSMNPADFEKYAIPLEKRTKIGPEMQKLASQGEIDKYTIPTDEYLQHLLRLREGFSDVPYLNLFKDEVGLPTMANVIGHEGRHRSQALASQGDTSSLVKINPRGDLREGMPRRTQEEFIEALKNELEQSNRLVLPETDGSYRRPAVEFPEPYAEGGAVEMSGGGTPRPPTEQERETLRKLRDSFVPAATEAERLKKVQDNLDKMNRKVSLSDNPDQMWMEVQEQKMAGGGLTKLAKLARAPAKTKAEIEAIAERMAPQVLGEYVRGKEGAKTVAGKTQKQFAREKELQHDIRPTSAERPLPKEVNIEDLKNQVMMGISGDPTITGQTIHAVGGRELRSPSPQHGGPLYGLGHDKEHFWASNLGAARNVQNRAREIAEQYDAPVVGNYVMMGPDSYSYAQHFADANLQNIRPEEMTKAQIEGFNKLIRQGSLKSGPRPTWPGIENPEEAYLHMAIDPELRKHFGNLMQMPTVTQQFGLPSGLDVAHAVTEPSLRDLEIGVTGKSMGLMRPDVKDLKLSEHPTYSHDIPGEFMGGMRFPVPYELSFPDSLKAVRENPAQAPQEFGSFKMAGPRQVIDQQLIDEIKAYEERMKKLTGKAAGGEISADDVIIEERPL